MTFPSKEWTLFRLFFELEIGRCNKLNLKSGLTVGLSLDCGVETQTMSRIWGKIAHSWSSQYIRTETWKAQRFVSAFCDSKLNLIFFDMSTKSRSTGIYSRTWHFLRCIIYVIFYNHYFIVICTSILIERFSSPLGMEFISAAHSLDRRIHRLWRVPKYCFTQLNCNKCPLKLIRLCFNSSA